MSTLDVKPSIISSYLAQSDLYTTDEFLILEESITIIPLRDRLRASDVEMRGTALQEVITLGSVGAVVVPDVIPLLEDPARLANCVEIRILALRALTEVGPRAEDAIPDLIRLLGDEDTVIAAHAAIALASIGRDAVPPLIDVLNTGSTRSQLLASLALGEIGSEAESAIPALEGIWRGDLVARQPHLRQRPTPNLPQPATPIPPNLEFSTPSNPLTSPPSIVQSTPSPVQPNCPATESFSATTDTQTPEIHLIAALALGKVGASSEGLAPVLIATLGHENSGLQMEAARGLGVMSVTSQEAVDGLVELLVTGDVLAKNVAEDALVSIGRPAVAALIEQMMDDDLLVHHRAIDVLGEIGHPAIQDLLPLLQDPDINIRRRSLNALGQMNHEAIPDLRTILVSSDNLDERKAAAAAIGLTELSDYQSIEILRSILQDENNSLDIRRVAASALEQLTGEPEEFLEHNRFSSPLSTVCNSGFTSLTEPFGFDVLTGRCQPIFLEIHQFISLQELLLLACDMLGC